MRRRHLVGHEEKALLGRKSDDILNALPALDLTCQQEGVRLEKVILRAGVFICCHLAVVLHNCEVTKLVSSIFFINYLFTVFHDPMADTAEGMAFPPQLSGAPMICWRGGEKPNLAGTNTTNLTSGVSRVDDAQGSGVAVRPGLVQGTLQLADVQTPALVFIQVVVDLHCPQFCQSSRVERILGYGDHDACAGRAVAAHKQF